MTTEHGISPETGPTIAGRFPGGPRRASAGATPRRRPALPDVGSQAARGADRQQRRTRRRRRNRVLIGFSVMLAFATGAGFYLGVSADVSLDELRSREAQATDDVVTDEVSRVLMELWKMEDVEAARARGGR